MKMYNEKPLHKISSTGDGLTILISCDYLLHHNWMSFLCWYSIFKNLPDAKIHIISPRKIINCTLFDWTRKCKIPFILHKNDADSTQIALDHGVKTPLLVVPPEFVCVRDFDEAGLSPNFTDVKKMDSEFGCDCKEDRFCVFATYLHGWGKFVTSEWINKTSCPFVHGAKYGRGTTVNEVRIEQLWNAATPLFQAVARG